MSEVVEEVLPHEKQLAEWLNSLTPAELWEQCPEFFA